MAQTENQEAVTYNFIEKNTQQVMGTMKIRYEVVRTGPWSTDADLGDILVGGICGGLRFAFPDQGAPGLSSGHSGDLKALGTPGFEEYGSSDGKTIDKGCIIGRVYGFATENQLMTLTFEYAGEYSHAESATTMRNGAPDEGGIGFPQPGHGDEHGDKYIYEGSWVREE